MPNQNKAFEFGPFRLEVRERRLTRSGHSVPLRGRVFDTLYALVSRHGCLVTKDELMAIIWPDRIVEESNLNHNICVLRRALGEKVTGQKYVETVPRQGYRFVADVRELDSFEGAELPRMWDTQEIPSPAGGSWAYPTTSSDGPPAPAEETAASPKPPSGSHMPWYRHQGVVSSLAVALLLIVGYFGVEQLPFFDAPSSARIMVAVLPFENLTGDSGQKYVADGLTHEIVAQLGRLNTSKVGVIANTSTRIYRNTQKSITEIGRELDVSYVIEGSLRRSQSSYRITVMLIQVQDQSHLWAANYDRPVGNVTNLQEEIARKITIEIGTRIDANSKEGTPAAYSRGSGSPQDDSACLGYLEFALTKSSAIATDILSRRDFWKGLTDPPFRIVQGVSTARNIARHPGTPLSPVRGSSLCSLKLRGALRAARRLKRNC